MESEAELAVRNYLMMLVEPEKLVDAGRIAALEEKIATSTDVLERLRLHTELNQAKLADTGHLKVGFIAHAKAWAAAEGIPASAFRDMGVSDEVLAAAGLIAPMRRGRTADSPAAGRRKSVSVADIHSWIEQSSGPFTVNDVVSAVGGSPVTVKKAIDQLVDAGRAQKIGPVPDHTGPGRAPTLYQVG